MPRASQMPRTRAVLTLLAGVRVAGFVLVAVGAIAVRGAGDEWWQAMLAFGAAVAVFVVVVTQLGKRTQGWLSRTVAADSARMSPAERTLPYGVVEEDGVLLLPTKVSLVALLGVLAAGILAAAGAALASNDPVGIGFGVAMVLLAAWLAVVCTRIAGTRVRLTSEGVESRMPIPAQCHRWIEVPEIEVRGPNILLRAATTKRPRLWIRTGLLEAGREHCLEMIRRQRGW